MEIMINVQTLIDSWPIILTLFTALIYQTTVNTKHQEQITSIEKHASEKITALKTASESAINALEKKHDEEKVSVWAKLDTMQGMLVQVLTGVANLEGRWHRKDSE